MPNPGCPSWEHCEAVICPLDQERHLVVWYPDEPICSGRASTGLPWVRRQRLIQRRARDRARASYYTLAMLEAIGRVSAALVGASPDRADGEAAWLRARRAKSPAFHQKVPATALH